MRRVPVRHLAVVLLAALPPACAPGAGMRGLTDQPPVPPPPPGAFMCPAASPSAAARTVGNEGGTVELRGHRLRIPPGHANGYRLEEPAAEYIVVQAHPDRVFQQGSTALLTISYGRCGSRPLPAPPYRVLRYDPATGGWQPVRGEVMHDAGARTISAPLPSLSGYAIAGG